LVNSCSVALQQRKNDTEKLLENFATFLKEAERNKKESGLEISKDAEFIKLQVSIAVFKFNKLNLKYILMYNAIEKDEILSVVILSIFGF
jgi:hypothetical protein